MKNSKAVSVAKAGSILLSAFLCVFGAVLLAYPGISATVLLYAVGALLIGYGIFKIIGYFSNDLFRLAFQFDLAFGVLLVIIGIFLLVRPEKMLAFVGFVIGILVLTDGLFKIQTALDARRFGLRTWWGILLLAILTAAAGVFLIGDPLFGANLMMIFAGISLLSEGLLNLFVTIAAVKIRKKDRSADIDAEFYVQNNL